jgi:lipid A 4'-phosphatase
MARFGLILVILAGVFAGAAVSIDPALDLRIGAYFQLPDVKAALAPFDSWLALLRDPNLFLTFVLVAVAIGTLAVKLIWPRHPALMSAWAALLILATFAIGPALLANGILKPHSGRPRPAAVVELGGTQPFVQWWDWRGGCDSNCSFVSGEASTAYASLAPAAAVPAPWRPVAIGAAIVFGTVVGVIRMISGSHFLTDIVFSGVFTALIVWLLHGSLYRWTRTCLTEEEIERFLDGRRMKLKAALARFRGRRVA